MLLNKILNNTTIIPFIDSTIIKLNTYLMTSIKLFSDVQPKGKITPKAKQIIPIVKSAMVDHCDRLSYSLMAFAPNGGICSVEDALAFDRH